MMFLVTVLLSSLLACVVTADKFCTVSNYHGRSATYQGICGPRIPQMLSVVCSPHGYHSVNKKSFYDTAPVSSSLGSTWQSGTESNDVFLPEKKALDYFDNLSKRTGNQNIVCECCVFQCSFVELQGYCLKPHDMKRIKQTHPDAPIFKARAPSTNVLHTYLTAARHFMKRR